MQLGIRLPFRGAHEGDDLIRVARAADESGFAAGFVGDHTVWPAADTAMVNPTSNTGKYPAAPDVPSYDAWTVLSFVAGVTRRLRLGTAVTILPNRNPVLFAKEVATLDHLSNGRVICGVGLGWLKEEFDALGVPFGRRRQRLEEGIAVLRTLWTERVAQFSGSEFQFAPVYCEPKPKQMPLPIWLGGHSDPALARAAALADGWYGSFLTPQLAAPMVERLRTRRRHSSRSDVPFTIAISRVVACAGDDPDSNLQGQLVDRRELSSVLRQYEDVGVDMLVLDTTAQRAEDLVALVDAVSAMNR